MGHLQFSPNDDKFDGTVRYWVESFTTTLGKYPTDQKELEARICLDRYRIQRAFKTIRPKLTQWPAPFKVIELLERRPEAKQLDHDPRHTEDAGSALNIMSKALIDLTEGTITKEQFDEIMEGFNNGCS